MKFGLNDLDQAARFIAEANGTVVVKPREGTGAGLGMATGIDDQEKLERAAITASLFSDTLIAEHQIKGASFRLLFLDGLPATHRTLGRRDPPTVVDDGQSSIGELGELENQRRIKSEKPVAFSTLYLDDEMRVTLLAQGLQAASIPAVGKEIIVKLVVNQNAARQNAEGSHVCTELQRLGSAIAKQKKNCRRLYYRNSFDL